MNLLRNGPPISAAKHCRLPIVQWPKKYSRITAHSSVYSKLNVGKRTLIWGGLHRIQLYTTTTTSFSPASFSKKGDRNADERRALFFSDLERMLEDESTNWAFVTKLKEFLDIGIDSYHMESVLSLIRQKFHHIFRQGDIDGRSGIEDHANLTQRYRYEDKAAMADILVCFSRMEMRYKMTRIEKRFDRSTDPLPSETDNTSNSSSNIDTVFSPSSSDRIAQYHDSFTTYRSSAIYSAMCDDLLDLFFASIRPRSSDKGKFSAPRKHLKHDSNQSIRSSGVGDYEMSTTELAHNMRCFAKIGLNSRHFLSSEIDDLLLVLNRRMGSLNNFNVTLVLYSLSKFEVPWNSMPLDFRTKLLQNAYSVKKGKQSSSVKLPTTDSITDTNATTDVDIATCSSSTASTMDITPKPSSKQTPSRARFELAREAQLEVMKIFSLGSMGYTVNSRGADNRAEDKDTKARGSGVHSGGISLGTTPSSIYSGGAPAGTSSRGVDDAILASAVEVFTTSLVLDRKSQFLSKSLCNTLKGLAQMGFTYERCSPDFNELLEHTMRTTIPHFSSSGLANVINSLSVFGWRWDDLHADTKAVLVAGSAQSLSEMHIRNTWLTLHGLSGLHATWAILGEALEPSICALLSDSANCTVPELHGENKTTEAKSTRYYMQRYRAEELHVLLYGLNQLQSQYRMLSPATQADLMSTLGKWLMPMWEGHLASSILYLSRMGVTWNDLSRPVKKAVLMSAAVGVRTMKKRAVSDMVLGLGAIGLCRESMSELYLRRFATAMCIHFETERRVLNENNRLDSAQASESKRRRGKRRGDGHVESMDSGRAGDAPRLAEERGVQAAIVRDMMVGLGMLKMCHNMWPTPTQYSIEAAVACSIKDMTPRETIDTVIAMGKTNMIWGNMTEWAKKEIMEAIVRSLLNMQDHYHMGQRLTDQHVEDTLSVLHLLYRMQVPWADLPPALQSAIIDTLSVLLHSPTRLDKDLFHGPAREELSEAVSRQKFPVCYSVCNIVLWLAMMDFKWHTNGEKVEGVNDRFESGIGLQQERRGVEESSGNARLWTRLVQNMIRDSRDRMKDGIDSNKDTCGMKLELQSSDGPCTWDLHQKLQTALVTGIGATIEGYMDCEVYTVLYSLNRMGLLSAVTSTEDGYRVSNGDIEEIIQQMNLPAMHLHKTDNWQSNWHNNSGDSPKMINHGKRIKIKGERKR